MNNVHPLFRQALAPFAPAPVVKAAPVLRPFAVSIRIAGKPEQINVLAFTSCDAICNAIDIFFDGDGVVPPEGLTLCARPISPMPRAA